MEMLENKIFMEVWMEYGNIGIWTFYGSCQTRFWCIFRHLLECSVECDVDGKQTNKIINQYIINTFKQINISALNPA